MLKRLFLTLLVALIPTAGYGQASVIQGGSFTSGLPNFYSSSGGSQPIIQQSATAAGGAQSIKEMSIISRGTGSAPFTGGGGGFLGSTFCLYDGPTTGPYHQLCLSPNATGNTGLLSFNAGGGASQIPLSFNVNGVSYSFPFPGTGTVTGPVSSTVGHVACWNNTLGTVLSDCGAGLSPGGTNGQVQYNNSGVFGGVTIGGDGTLNTGTGSLVVTKTNGVNFTAAATTAIGTSGATLPLLNGANTWGANQTLSASIIAEAQGADIASSGTTNLCAASGNFVRVTGNTTITALGTCQAGTRVTVRFAASPLLTYNATSLILPTAGNITPAAGDIATFISLGSGNWVCTSYQLASGAALTVVNQSVQGPTFQTFTSGSAATYTTPASVKWIRIRMVGAGGGGGGVGGTTGPTGATGGTTTFNTVTAVGGTGGVGNNSSAGSNQQIGGIGGTGGTGSAAFRVPGTAGGVLNGNQGVATVGSGPGGNSAFFAGGAPSGFQQGNTQVYNGNPGATNSGGGGSGAVPIGQQGSSGGGGGESVEFVINNPSASYTYTVGAAGAGGIGTGTNPATGGAGAAGLIVVEEHYNF